MARLPDYVRPGDLVFVRGIGLIPWCIRKLTKSQFAHVAIVVNCDKVIEAWPGGVRMIPCPYPPGEYIIKTRSDLTDSQRKNIVAYAKKFIGTKYDYVRIFALLLEILFHLKNKIFMHKHIICSAFAALSYLFGAEVRLRADKAIYHLTPEDILEDQGFTDYAIAN